MRRQVVPCTASITGSVFQSEQAILSSSPSTAGNTAPIMISVPVVQSSLSSTVSTPGPCAQLQSTNPYYNTAISPGPCVVSGTGSPSLFLATSLPPVLPVSVGHKELVRVKDLWDPKQPSPINPRALATTSAVEDSTRARKVPNLVRSDVPSAMIEPLLPFGSSDDMAGFEIPAKPILKPGLLKSCGFVLPNGKCFMDKILPRPSVQLVENDDFNSAYFVDLHHRATAPGQRGQYTWKQGTPNYLGARIPLKHVKFNLASWRKHLIGYEKIEILQYMEFGFPLGLDTDSISALSPALANHGSAYQFYPWLDKFFTSGLIKGGVSGPYGSSPFQEPMLSPLMTAFKKPNERRAVYDATFGQYSLNNCTPSDNYLGEKCLYTYPKLEDFQSLILSSGRGCLLWKRDLARYYLQLPLDPIEYKYTGAIWRGLFFFFTALMFGLRHSGLQGQRVSDALAWVHRNQGLEYLPTGEREQMSQPTVETRHIAIVPELDPDRPVPYHVVNYCDDLAGCERSSQKSTASFQALGSLMGELGLEESVKKASPPSTKMVFLGVHFDTVEMTMCVPPEKIQELRFDLDKWVRKTTTVRKDLQSILGKLFWVSRVVKFSRPFMGRLLQQLRDMKGLPDTKRVPLSDESRKDLTWWSTYLRSFNGVSLIVNDDDNLQTLEHLILSPFKVYAGDATLWGGGGWYRDEYWSQEFPNFLKPTEIPVHIKEFWVLVASCWLWGDDWSGCAVYLFCDNDSVCDSITHQKPRDPDLGSLLREFLYVVCLKKFCPIIRKIDTKSNFLADHISRRYDHDSAKQVFNSVGKTGMKKVSIPDFRFKLSAPW